MLILETPFNAQLITLSRWIEYPHTTSRKEFDSNDRFKVNRYKRRTRKEQERTEKSKGYFQTKG